MEELKRQRGAALDKLLKKMKLIFSFFKFYTASVIKPSGVRTATTLQICLTIFPAVKRHGPKGW